MEYYEKITLKNGADCILRGADVEDAKALLDIFLLTHEQTDFLLTYPDENNPDVAREEEFLRKLNESGGGLEIIAELDGKVVGSAGFSPVGTKDKIRHRAEFGVSVDRDYWGLGVGRALTRACIECARRAGYVQLELDVIAANERAVRLYQSEGFVEFGRNPKGFRSRLTGWQEIVLMRRELDDNNG